MNMRSNGMYWRREDIC